MTTWTGEEWEWLADQVMVLRGSDPVSPLVTLVKSVLPQLPAARRREIRTAQELTQLIPILNSRTERLKDLSSENASLRAKLRPMDNDEIVYRYSKLVLESLTVEERLDGLTAEQLLAVVPVDQLAAETARRLVQTLTSQPIRPLQFDTPTAPINVEQVRKKGLSKVCLIGCKGDQISVIEKSVGPLCQLKFVSSKDINQIPTGQDYYVVWINFVSHAVTNKCKNYSPVGGYIQVVGGVESIISKLQGVLTC